MNTCRLVYDMGELGETVFEFQSAEPHKEAHALMTKNPPGPTVCYVYLETGYAKVIYDSLKSFSLDAYNKAVEDKKWKDGCYQRTGRQWQDQEPHKRSSESPPETDAEEMDLDFETCLSLLGLGRNFSEKELKAAYRKAVKMNHPDKVASLSEEFKTLADRKTKQINQAYAKLLKKASNRRPKE